MLVHFPPYHTRANPTQFTDKYTIQPENMNQKLSQMFPKSRIHLQPRRMFDLQDKVKPNFNWLSKQVYNFSIRLGHYPLHYVLKFNSNIFTWYESFIAF